MSCTLPHTLFLLLTLVAILLFLSFLVLRSDIRKVAKIKCAIHTICGERSVPTRSCDLISVFLPPAPSRVSGTLSIQKGTPTSTHLSSDSALEFVTEKSEEWRKVKRNGVGVGELRIAPLTAWDGWAALILSAAVPRVTPTVKCPSQMARGSFGGGSRPSAGSAKTLRCEPYGGYALPPLQGLALLLGSPFLFC